MVRSVAQYKGRGALVVRDDQDDESDDDRQTPPRAWAAQERPTATEVARHRKSVPAGTPVVMSDTDRALLSRPHRRPPVEYVGDDITSPRAIFDLEERDYAAEVAELQMQLRRAGIDLHAAIAALAVNATRAKEREHTGQRDLNAKLEAFLSVQPGGAKWAGLESAVNDLRDDIEEIQQSQRFDDLAKKVTELQGGMQELSPVRSLVRWIGWGLVGTILVVAIGGGSWLYARGGKEERIDLKIEGLEKLTDKIVERLDQMYARERHSHEEPHP